MGNSYCDVFQKCREVDPSGPLATLRKLLLSEESIASFKKWMQHNWYTVALAVVGVFVLLVSTDPNNKYHYCSINVKNKILRVTFCCEKTS